MRRLAIALGALAFLWACAATVYLLLASSQTGIAASAMLAASAVEANRIPPSLATSEGAWMAGLLMGVTLFAGLPLGVALAHPSGQRLTALTVGLLLLGFCVLSAFSVGLLYVPSAILLIVAGGVSKVEPRSTPIGDGANARR